MARRSPPGPNGPTKSPAGERSAGPSPQEVALIRGTAVELKAALPELTDEEAIHFATEAVKEQPGIVEGLRTLFRATQAGAAEVAWLELTIFKPESNIIETDAKPEVIAVFAGPSRPSRTNTPRQMVGAAVARSLCTSTFSRALLYACGMRLKFSAVKSPVRKVEGG